MITSRDPKEIAEAMISRSVCQVQVGACIADVNGVFAWGWNSVGFGFGRHAEEFAISRANRKRLPRATLYVATVRARNKKIITSKPCQMCQAIILAAKIGRVVYRDADGIWKEL